MLNAVVPGACFDGDVRVPLAAVVAGVAAWLHLPHELWPLPASQRGHPWRAAMPSALACAAAGFKL